VLFSKVTMCRFVPRSLCFGGACRIKLEKRGSHSSIFVSNSGNHARHEFVNQKSTSQPSPPSCFSLIRFIQFTHKILFI